MGTLRSGDAFASPLPATLSQRQLYPTNNLLRKSEEDEYYFAKEKAKRDDSSSREAT